MYKNIKSFIVFAILWATNISTTGAQAYDGGGSLKIFTGYIKMQEFSGGHLALNFGLSDYFSVALFGNIYPVNREQIYTEYGGQIDFHLTHLLKMPEKTDAYFGMRGWIGLLEFHAGGLYNFGEVLGIYGEYGRAGKYNRINLGLTFNL